MIDLPRSTPRAAWKAIYRLLRITRRESYKAAADMLTWGTGYIEVGEHLPDLIRHVPFEEITA